MDLAVLDFETYYAQDYSLSKMTTEEYVRSPQFQIIGVAVRTRTQPAYWYSYDTVEEYAEKLAPLNNMMCVMHNTMFDASILNWHLGIRPKFLIDTLSMARPLVGMTSSLSLDALTQLYGVGVKGKEVIQALGKRREDFSAADLQQYGEYCKNDVEITYKLFKKLGKSFPKDELRIIDMMLRMFTEPVVELDRPLLEEHLLEVQRRKQALLDKATALVGDLSLASNNQFADILRKLGVEPPMKISPATKKETYALSKKDPAFKELSDHPDERVQTVVAARLGTKSTQEETRTTSFLAVQKRGTLPIMLNYFGAHTGRASGGDGLNLQNLPSRDPKKTALRRSLRAPEGHVFVACDSSQIEARVVACVAGQEDLVEAFRKGVDIYSDFASDLYGYPVDRKLVQVNEDGKESKPFKKEGDVGKAAILGLGFQMGAAKFQTTAKVEAGIILDDAEALRIVEFYRTKYPDIVALWGENENALHALVRGASYEVGTLNTRYERERVYLPNGLYMSYPGICYTRGEWPDGRPKQSTTYYRRRGRGSIPKDIYGGKATENLIQALARVIVFDQMLEIGQRYKVVLTVHDEVVCCVPEDSADEAERFMVDVMSQPPKWAPNLPIACEAAVGKTYYDCK